MYGRYLCSATRCISATKAFKPNEPSRKSYFSASFRITLDVLAFAYIVVLCAHLSFGERVCVCVCARVLWLIWLQKGAAAWQMGGRMLGKQNEPSSISQRRDASCSFGEASVTSSGDNEHLQLNPNYGRLSCVGSRMTSVIICSHILLDWT